jgi:hypothetical protein
MVGFILLISLPTSIVMVELFPDVRSSFSVKAEGNVNVFGTHVSLKKNLEGSTSCANNTLIEFIRVIATVNKMESLFDFILA